MGAWGGRGTVCPAGGWDAEGKPIFHQEIQYMQSQRASCATPNTETLWPQESQLRKLSGLPVYVLEGLFVQCAHPMVCLDYLLLLCKCPICSLNSSLSQWGLLMCSLDFDFSVNSCAAKALTSQCGLPLCHLDPDFTVWTPVCSLSVYLDSVNSLFSLDTLLSGLIQIWYTHSPGFRTNIVVHYLPQINTDVKETQARKPWL